MYLFIERGGISTEMQRYAKANNPYLHDHHPDKETSYILYLDANNLYGWAMSQPLPVGNFRRMRKMPTEKQIMSWQVKRKTGLILEVDLEYPQELHDKHNSYPLAPETIQVPEDWYSPYQKELARKLGLSKDKTEKLLLTLKDKENYVIHYRKLQLYLSLGMRLKQEHSVLAFDQEDWMEPYTRLNTELRKKAASDFKKNFFKLMNNSVFGRTVENLRKRTIVKLVRIDEEKKLRELLSDLLYAQHSIFGESQKTVKWGFWDKLTPAQKSPLLKIPLHAPNQHKPVPPIYPIFNTNSHPTLNPQILLLIFSASIFLLKSFFHFSVTTNRKTPSHLKNSIFPFLLTPA